MMNVPFKKVCLLRRERGRELGKEEGRKGGREGGRDNEHMPWCLWGPKQVSFLFPELGFGGLPSKGLCQLSHLAGPCMFLCVS